MARRPHAQLGRVPRPSGASSVLQVLGLPVFAQVRGERGLLAWRKVGEFRKDLKCEGRSVPGGNWLPDVVARGS
ncbi:MAG TPA: hypothetical protein VJY33_00730, partial [Isosphaeraceae bacterium]|nr:hypothetical protein [Isosphaeraceae bacterium]